MRVDQTGRWLDPGEIDATIGYRLAEQFGLDTSCLDCGLSKVPATESQLLPFEADEEELGILPEDPSTIEWEDPSSEPETDPDFPPLSEPVIE